MLGVLAALAVAPQSHAQTQDALLDKLVPGGVFADVKSAYDPERVRKAGHTLWRL